MLKSYGVGGGVVGWVAHVILVSAQVLLVLTLGLWTSDLGLTTSTIRLTFLINCKLGVFLYCSGIFYY